MHQGKVPTDVVGNPLPENPDLALFVGTLFERLGGRLTIDAKGHRRACRPTAEELQSGIPQLADAQSLERFHSVAEWRGAIKLAAYWVDRLGQADKERVYTLLAAVELDSEPDFDFRGQL